LSCRIETGPLLKNEGPFSLLLTHDKGKAESVPHKGGGAEQDIGL
jgi:hypothetical protein